MSRWHPPASARQRNGLFAAILKRVVVAAIVPTFSACTAMQARQLEQMDQGSRRSVLEQRTSQELCSAYNHNLILPESERQIYEILQSRGVSRCDAHGLIREIAPAATPVPSPTSTPTPAPADGERADRGRGRSKSKPGTDPAPQPATQQAPSDAALAPLRELAIAAEVGVNLSEYSRRLVDARIATERTLADPSAVTSPEVAQRARESIANYQRAADVWNLKIAMVARDRDGDGRYPYFADDGAVKQILADCPEANASGDQPGRLLFVQVAAFWRPDLAIRCYWRRADVR